MKAIVLAAGHGTRMQGYDRLNGNKVMLPLKDGRPILDHIVTRLSHSGFEPIIAISQNTYGDQIKEYFNGRGIPISEADTPSGTAGEVYNARGLLQREKRFLVYYGDTIANVDLAAMRQQHEAERNIVTMCGSRHFDIGEGMLRKEGSTITLVEKPLLDFSVFGQYPNCPIFYAEGEVLDYIERMRPNYPAELDFSRHVIPAMSRDGKKMGLYIHEGFYYNVGKPEIHKALLARDLDF